MADPNIIVILADDLGYSDLGSFGGEIDTPHLDELAARGVRMSSFYVTPRCSPSRAALLTGRQPHSVGIGVLTKDDRPNGYRGALGTDVPTLAERLSDSGYVTCLTGKWHLSSNTAQPNETWPTRRGFDEFYGILPGCSSYYQPPLIEGENRLPSDATLGDYYITDDISQRAVDFVDRSLNQSQPFFLYLAYTAPHWPLHAREADIAKYRERFAEGWDALRAKRLERLRQMGISSVTELPERDPRVRSWNAAKSKQWEIDRMATYAAQVEAMDKGIGRVFDELKRHGATDDTLVIFSSDNGACAEDLPISPDRPLSEDQCPPLTRDGLPVTVGNLPTLSPGPEATYGSYGRAWANLSNTPFRLFKRWVHEGGISSALIASWPGGGISSGGISYVPGHITDIVPTVMDAIRNPGGDPGSSLLAHWRKPENDGTEERTFCWEHIGNAALRRGRWKLVREQGQPWELYDIVADRSESSDLADENPVVVNELIHLWQEWADSNGVIPWDAVLADYRDRGRDESEARG